MKKINTAIAIAFSILLVVSCNKINDLWDCHKDKDGKPSQSQLKEVVHGTRHYLFFYSNTGLADSIQITDVKESSAYHVVRKANRIDSINFIRNGSLKWTNTNIAYDNNSKPIKYTHYLLVPPSLPVETTVTYDQGHVHAITTIDPYLYFLSKFDTLTFDQNNNIVRWVSKIPRSTALDINTYTYDTGLNPLYIDDLFLIFAEERFFFWEFVLSQHNSITKTYHYFNSTITYQNQYDMQNRLVKKVFTDRGYTQPDSLEFHY